MGLAPLTNGIKDLLFQNSQAAGFSWLQKMPDTARHESIGVNHVFFEIKAGILLIEVAQTVPIYTMPENQVLRPGGRLNRISLNKSQSFDRTPQGCWLKKRIRDGKAS